MNVIVIWRKSKVEVGWSWSWLELKLVGVEVGWNWRWLELKLELLGVEVGWSWSWCWWELNLVGVEVVDSWIWLELKLLRVEFGWNWSWSCWELKLVGVGVEVVGSWIWLELKLDEVGHWWPICITGLLSNETAQCYVICLPNCAQVARWIAKQFLFITEPLNNYQQMCCRCHETIAKCMHAWPLLAMLFNFETHHPPQGRRQSGFLPVSPTGQVHPWIHC